MRIKYADLYAVSVVLLLHAIALPCSATSKPAADATSGELEVRDPTALTPRDPNVLEDIKDGLHDIGSEIGKFGAESFRWISKEWETAVVPFANKVIQNAEKTLNDAVRGLDSEVVQKVEAIKSTVNDVATQAHALQTPLVALAEDKGMNRADVSNGLNIISDKILPLLQAAFPPPSRAPSHKQRQEMVEFTLTKFEDGLTSLLRTLGISSNEFSAFSTTWGQLILHITTAIVTIGDIIEQHPFLVNSLVFFILAQLQSDDLILRALLNLLGFSPLGPVKGSAAAWAQRQFFGATVEKGVWFAAMQKAGMTGLKAKL